MQAPGKERSLLRDLALIYIALAHGTDQDLSKVEVETISRRLSGWQSHVTEETVLSAIKDALEDYTEESAKQELEEAVRRVRSQVDADMREAILEDLTEIAMSDDKFLHEEGAFIGDLARAWEVQVDEKGTEETPWSVLLESKVKHNGWSPLHDLALVYLHLAHRTDSEIDEREVDAIASTLREWTPDITQERVLKVVQSAMHAYVQGPDKRLFEDSIETLKDAVPAHQRASLLNDLHKIAEADGKVLPEEREVVNRLSQAWEIQAQA